MGKPNKYKGHTFPERQGPRPHIWISGPDPQRHEQYIAWQRTAAQARFRGETWRLEFEEYVECWADQWENRGRHSDDLCMCRINPKRPWTARNVQLMSRAEHVRTTHQRKT